MRSCLHKLQLGMAFNPQRRPIGTFFYLIFIGFILPHLVLGWGPQDITTVPGYQNARYCEKKCLYGIEDLGFRMGCDNDDAVCFCRPDLRELGSSALSECLVSRCASTTRNVKMSLDPMHMTYAFAGWNEFCLSQGQTVGKKKALTFLLFGSWGHQILMRFRGG